MLIIRQLRGVTSDQSHHLKNMQICTSIECEYKGNRIPRTLFLELDASDISHCLPQRQPNVCCTTTAGSAFACKLLNKNRFHNIKHCYSQVYWFFPARPCLLLTSIFGAHLSPGHKGQRAKTWSPRHNKLRAQRRFNACFVKQISTFVSLSRRLIGSA